MKHPEPYGHFQSNGLMWDFASECSAAKSLNKKRLGRNVVRLRKVHPNSQSSFVTSSPRASSFRASSRPAFTSRRPRPTPPPCPTTALFTDDHTLYGSGSHPLIPWSRRNATLPLSDVDTEPRVVREGDTGNVAQHRSEVKSRIPSHVTTGRNFAEETVEREAFKMEMRILCVIFCSANFNILCRCREAYGRG